VQDRDGVLDGRLVDEHGREAAGQRAVALDLLVLAERRGADHPQHAAGEHRLEHVRGVHRALGAAGAQDGVQLVHEQDDGALGLLDLGQDGLQALLELAAVLGAGHHAGEVERDDAHAAQRVGDVGGGDAAGQALHDRGLAHAGLADEHRVGLPAAGEDLDDLLDLLVAADDRVDAALAGVFGEVVAELVERGSGRAPGLGRGVLAHGGASGARAERRGTAHRRGLAAGHELLGAHLAQSARHALAGRGLRDEGDGAGRRWHTAHVGRADMELLTSRRI
jgi:hypothetical protein